jgi:uncharacterized protein YkwD
VPRTLREAIGFLLGLWLALALLLPLVSGRARASDLPGGESDRLEQALHREINAVREARHLIPLRREARLDGVARAHSQDMARGGYLAHENAAGESPLDRVLRGGVEGITLAAENAGQTDRADVVQEIVQGWLASPVHRNNLLAPVFNATGIGVARRSDGTWLVTQLYVTYPRER